jgi:hypothetical protein
MVDALTSRAQGHAVKISHSVRKCPTELARKPAVSSSMTTINRESAGISRRG